MKDPLGDTLLRIVVTIASAASLAVLAPPMNLHFLHWFVYLPMLWVLRDGKPKANALYGWLYGTVAVAVLFRWLIDTIALFSNIPLPIAVLLILLAGAVFGLPYIPLWLSVHPLRNRLGIGWVVAVPAVQVVLEYASEYVLLFPYNHGVSQFRFPFTWQLVSVTGILGMTWLVFFVNCCVGEAIYRRREGRPMPVAPIASAVIAWSLVVMFGAWRFTSLQPLIEKAPLYRIAQLQSAMTMPQIMDRLYTDPGIIFRAWLAKTRSVPPGAADLVIWPEGASLWSLQEPKTAKLFRDSARTGGFEMLVGSGARDKKPGTTERTGEIAFNTVFHVAKDGKIDRYDKMVPLPFGEYMPFHESAPWLVDWIEGPGNFQAGQEAVVFQGEKYRIATPICYEAILSGICRKFDGPDILITVTQDAWFGDTAAPWQHAMLAAVRSTELGIPMYRAAYTGVSMVVEPDGTIRDETQPFTEVDRIVSVQMVTIPTIYARFGDWFVALCALGLVAGLAWTEARRRSA